MSHIDDLLHSEMVLDTATAESASEKAIMRRQIQEAMKHWRGKIKRLTASQVSAGIKAANKRTAAQYKARQERSH